MKKKNSGAEANQPKNKQETLQKDDSTPKNLPPREDMPLNQGKEYKIQAPSSRHKKPDQLQAECITPPKQILGRIPGDYHGNDENLIPEQGLGKIPDEEVDEKSKNI